jgi:S-methylmethionine-dependent homocysteine/selenocysteine methylase
VHTANTFRTQRRHVGAAWSELASQAVSLARTAVRAQHRVAGSLAPLEDCYHPERSPPNAGPEHAELAQVLAQGCDLLLVETFPHVGEALAAAEAALATGKEVWVSFTAGPSADLLTPGEMAEGARRAAALGASAVLVNCVPAQDTLRFVQAIRDAVPDVAVGAYANAGPATDGIGWHEPREGPERYGDLAESWVLAGATLVGSCCGTGPAHIAALHSRFCAR